ncbi:hypothetical protein [Thalassiella azotivora]
MTARHFNHVDGPPPAASQMDVVDLLADLGSATTRAGVDAARLTLIRQAPMGSKLVAPEPSEAHLVLAGLDPAWDGKPRTVAAWVSALTTLALARIGDLVIVPTALTPAFTPPQERVPPSESATAYADVLVDLDDHRAVDRS